MFSPPPDDTTVDDDDTTGDLDGDGWTVDEGDCDDDDPAVYPGATEIPCDEIDNDCDPETADGSDTDEDGDGYSVCDDCNDLDPAVHPGAEEVCNSIDDDCDGDGPLEEVDGDGDGYAPCEADCDDDDPAVYPGSPSVIEVPAHHPSIGEGMEAAVDGEVVCVGPGTYFERIDFQGKKIRVIGIDGADDTVIDGSQHEGSVVWFHSGEGTDSELQRITIANGTGHNGGGLRLESSSPTLRDIVVTGNTATDNGGGIYSSASSPVIVGVSAVDNTAAEAGGGLYFLGGTPILVDVELTGNHSDEGGGGAQFRCSTPTMSNVVASDNSTDANGGGLHFWMGAGLVTHSLVVANKAQGTGGGLMLRDSAVEFDTSMLVGNQASDHGGGAMLRSHTGTMTNVTIVGNSGDAGAGIYLGSSSNLALTNVIIVHNISTGSGGLQVSTGNLVLQHCDIWGNVPNDVFGTAFVPGVDGNRREDPMFLSTAGTYALAWDLHLAPDSPLVDAGAGTLLDPDHGPSDMGGFGGPGAGSWDLDRDDYPGWWRPGPYDAATSPGMDCADLEPHIYPGNGC